MKSTTSIGVKTIPNLSVVDLNAVLKNLSYKVTIIFCLSSAFSIPSARILTDSYKGSRFSCSLAKPAFSSSDTIDSIACETGF